jgi:DNA-binding NarL/FixJ family response regulator
MQPSVLLVEDHSAVREATEAMLRTAGFRVMDGTGDVARARALIRQWQPQVAVVDLRLAGQSGLRLARLLTREHPELRLVVFTAVDDPAERRSRRC